MCCTHLFPQPNDQLHVEEEERHKKETQNDKPREKRKRKKKDSEKNKPSKLAKKEKTRTENNGVTPSVGFLFSISAPRETRREAETEWP